MNKKVWSILLILVVLVAALAYLNAGDREERVESQRDALIYITEGEERKATIDFAMIEELETHEFEAVLRSSSNPDRDITYTGVLMKDLLEHSGVNLEEFTQVITKASDGYTVALSISEIEEDDNVYVAYMHDGEYMRPKDEGGSGPFQIIIRQEEFGQRWNKFLMEIELR